MTYTARLLILLPLTALAGLIPAGIAAAKLDPGTAVSRPPTPAAATPGAAVLEPPRPGSGIDTSKLVPGLTATYGAATGGLFYSPPIDPASGFVAEDAQHQPPAVGEIHSYLASDGKVYYRVVNRSPTRVTYSH